MISSNSVLLDTLTQTLNLLQALELHDRARSLQAAVDRLQTRAFRIVLVGEYGRGKSALINALLGAKILAESAVPVQTVNVVRWAATPVGRVGHIGLVEPVALEKLAEEEYARVELDYPLAFIHDDVEIVELPGIPNDLDSPDLVAHIEQADLVVVILACDALYSASDNRLVERIRILGHHDIFFACNFIDRIPADEVMSIQRSAYVRIPANQDRIFFTSPPHAQIGDAAAQASITAFVETLSDVIATKRASLKTERASRLLQEAVNGARAHVDERHSAARKIASESEQRITSLNGAYESLASAGRQVIANVDEFQQHTRDVVQNMTIGFIRDLALKSESWLNGYSGDDPKAYMESQFKQAVQTWHMTELNRYLREQFGYQRATLDAGIERYRIRLRDLATLLPALPDDLQVPVSLDAPETQTFDAWTDIRIPVTTDKQQISITQMPEVMLLAAASLAALALIRPLALGIPLGITGIGFAGALATRRTHDAQAVRLAEAGREYAADLRLKADSIAALVWQTVSTHLEEMKRQIEDAIQTQTHHIRTAVHADIARLQAPQYDNTALEERLKILESQIAALI
jgi:hypothetical protein